MPESIFNLIDQHGSNPSLLPKHVATYQPTAVEAPPALRKASSLRNAVAQPTKSAVAVGGSARAPARNNAQATAAAAMKAPSMAVYEMAKAAAQQPQQDLPKIKTKPGIPAAARPKKEEDPAVVARKRQQAQMRGTAMAVALAPEIRRDVRRLPKNHVNDNVEKLKEQSIVNGLIKEQGEWSRPAGRKPEFTGRAKQAPGPEETNFVEENRRAILENAEKSKRAAAPRGQKYQQAQRPAGQIPKYLIERKIEMEVEKAMQEDEEKRRNGGPAVMPEEERLATLKELETQKAAALKELNLIPPSKVELAAYKAQVKRLETRLEEIDKAILLFSRKVVYVQ